MKTRIKKQLNFTLLLLHFSIGLLSQNSPRLIKDLLIDGNSAVQQVFQFNNDYYYFARDRENDLSLFQKNFDNDSIPKLVSKISSRTTVISNIEHCLAEDKFYFVIQKYNTKIADFWESDGTPNGTKKLKSNNDSYSYVKKSIIYHQKEIFYHLNNKDNTTTLWSLTKDKLLTPVPNFELIFTFDKYIYYAYNSSLWRAYDSKIEKFADFNAKSQLNEKVFGFEKGKSAYIDLGTGIKTVVWNGSGNWYDYFDKKIFITNDNDTLNKVLIVKSNLQVDTIFSEKTISYIGKIDKFHFLSASNSLWVVDSTNNTVKKYTGNLSHKLIVNLGGSHIINNDIFFTNDTNDNFVRINLQTEKVDTIKNIILNKLLCIKNDKIFFTGGYKTTYLSEHELMELDKNTTLAKIYFKHNTSNVGSRPELEAHIKDEIYFNSDSEINGIKNHWKIEETSNNPSVILDSTLSNYNVLYKYNNLICLKKKYGENNIVLFDENTQKIVFQKKFNFYLGDIKLVSNKLYFSEYDPNNNSNTIYSVELDNNFKTSKIFTSISYSIALYSTSKGIFFNFFDEKTNQYLLYFYNGTQVQLIANQFEKYPFDQGSIYFNKDAAIINDNLYFLKQVGQHYVIWKSDGSINNTKSLCDTCLFKFNNTSNFDWYSTEKFIYINFVDNQNSYIYQFGNNTISKIEIKNQIVRGIVSNQKNLFLRKNELKKVTLLVLNDDDDNNIKPLYTAKYKIFYADSKDKKSYFISSDTTSPYFGKIIETDGLLSGTSEIVNFEGIMNWVIVHNDKLICAFDDTQIGMELYYIPLKSVSTHENLTYNLQKLILYPSDFIKIKADGEDMINNNIEIFDINGRLISKQYVSSIIDYNIDTSILAKGIYFVRLQNDNCIKVGKFVIER